MSAPTVALSVLNFPESYTLEKEDIKSQSSFHFQYLRSSYYLSQEGGEDPRIFWKGNHMVFKENGVGSVASERVLRVDYRQRGSLECHKALGGIM